MKLQEYLKAFFKIDDNTAATIIITIIVFFVGQVAIGVARAISSEIQNATRRRLFRFGLQALHRAAKMQSRYFQELSAGLSLQHSNIPGLPRISGGLLKVQDELNIGDTLAAFNNPLRKHFYYQKTVQKSILRVYAIQSGLKSVIDESHQLYSNQLTNYRELAINRDSKALALQSFIHGLNGKRVDDVYIPFYEALSRIYDDWLARRSKNAWSYNRYFIARVRILIKKSTHTGPYADELAERARDIQLDYTRMYHLIRGLKRQFMTLSKGMDGYRRQLDVIKRVLK